MSNGKAMIIHLMVGLIKKILLYKMSHVPPHSHDKKKRKVKSDFSNYSTESYLKNATDFDRSLKKMT